MQDGLTVAELLGANANDEGSDRAGRRGRKDQTLGCARVLSESLPHAPQERAPATLAKGLACKTRLAPVIGPVSRVSRWAWLCRVQPVAYPNLVRQMTSRCFVNCFDYPIAALTVVSDKCELVSVRAGGLSLMRRRDRATRRERRRGWS
jgi:hypothetical protein